MGDGGGEIARNDGAGHWDFVAPLFFFSPLFNSFGCLHFKHFSRTMD